MKVYTVWRHYAHDYDSLMGIFKLEEDAIACAEKEKIYGDEDTVKWETPVNVFTDNKDKTLHIWTTIEAREMKDTWNVITVEENEVL